MPFRGSLMQRFHQSLLSLITLGLVFVAACGPEPIDVPEDDDDDDNGGTGPTGGFGGVNTGGFSGTPATGGFSTGGVSGTPATGGATTGGTPATGGVSGTPATGGTAGAGISGAAGMATGGTGSTATCDPMFTVGMDGFVRAPGTTGCMHGYAFSGGDTGSTLTTPTSFATCGANCMLRVAGTLGPATEANMYAGVVYLGFNVNQAAGSTTAMTLVPTGTSLVVTYTKVSGPATIRVQIQTAATRWCADLTASPATIAYTTFNTTCWAPAMGVAYAKEPIEAIQLVAPGGEAATPIDMTLVSVKDM
jgi:hypothetical protein